jgi:cysteine desulfurase
MTKHLYLDYMSTTPIDFRVKDIMVQCMDVSGNAASPTMEGKAALKWVEKGRLSVATLIHARSEEIIFTSGASESNNLALKGAAYFYQRQGKHIITMSTEHKAVLHPCRHLENEGFEVTYLSPEKNGRLNLMTLSQAIRPDTVLVSIMHVNNETGVIQDIDAIARLTKKHGVLFHVDAAQSASRLKINVSNCPIDLLSLSSHKMYGPKGMGALYIRQHPRRVQLVPQIHGGGHELGLRSGTLSPHLIAGFGQACEIVQKEMEQERLRMQILHDIFFQSFGSIDLFNINGDSLHRIPDCLSMTIPGVNAERLLAGLPNLSLSAGSACSTFNISPSHVLLAIGLSPLDIQSTIRLSFGRYTSFADIQYAAGEIKDRIRQLK